MKAFPTLLAAVLILGAHAESEAACSADLDAQLRSIERDWVNVNYHTQSREARVRGFEALAKRVNAVSSQHEGCAEPLTWEGIVLGTQARDTRGLLGALGIAKRARARLEAAERIDPDALGGSVYMMLGTLYYKVPGWPLGFGNDARARRYLEKALEVDPDSPDSNFFYAEFLIEQGETAEARRRLENALKLPVRPDHAEADRGRKEDIRRLLQTVEGAR